MFTIFDVMKEYQRLDKLTGMDITKTVKVSSTGRCTNRRGVYKSVIYKDGRLENEKIIISNFVFSEPMDSFMDTVRHEYAHAMAAHIHRRAKLGHGPEWKECCKVVGCKAERYVEASEAQMAVIKERESKAHGYILRCKECGHEWKYKKMCKTLKGVQAGRKYNCPYCGKSEFEVEGV